MKASIPLRNSVNHRRNERWLIESKGSFVWVNKPNASKSRKPPPNVLEKGISTGIKNSTRSTMKGLASIGCARFALGNLKLLSFSVLSKSAEVAVALAFVAETQDSCNAFRFENLTDLSARLTFPCRRQPLALVSAELLQTSPMSLKLPPKYIPAGTWSYFPLNLLMEGGKSRNSDWTLFTRNTENNPEPCLK